MRSWFIPLAIYVLVTIPAYNALRPPWMVSGHDADAAVFKAIELKNALLDGHFPVRWSKRLDFGLGLPTFTFTYNLPYYLAAGLSFLGMSVISAEKLIMGASFPISAFFTYLWLKRRFGQWPSFVGGLLYSIVPYHFLNVYVRFAIGEVVAATFLPLVFYSIDRLLDRTTGKNIALCGTSMAVLLLSHQFYGLIFVPLGLAYGFIAGKKRVVWVGAALGLGLLLGSYYLIPMVAYRGYTYLSDPQEYFLANNNFVMFQDLIKPAWGFGDLKKAVGDRMSLQIGIVHLALFGAGIWRMVVGKDKNRRLLIFFMTLAALSVVMMTPISLPIWKLVPILQNIQFPWRLISVVVTAAAFCGAFVLNEWKPKWIVVAVGILLFVAYKDYWRVGKYDTWEDKTVKSIGWPGTLTMLLEETPRWHKIKQEPNPYHQSQLPEGIAVIENLVWKTNYHKFMVDAETESVMSDKTHYWPGWTVYLDGVQVPMLDPYNSLSQGLITFKVPRGKHEIEVRLLETPLEKVANSISIVGLVIVGGLLFAPDRYLGIFKKFGQTQSCFT